METLLYGNRPVRNGSTITFVSGPRWRSRMKFDLDEFFSDCKRAIRENVPQVAINEVLARAVSDGSSIRRVLGGPKRAQRQKLYQGSDLTSLSAIRSPWL